MYNIAAVFSIALTLLSTGSRADMILMRDFIQLTKGMTEAEVLYRIGPFDHESVYTDHHHTIIRKTWYYIPERHSSSSWITEIKFNRLGHIQSMERYRARR